MKMWSVKVIILLLFCYACLSAGSDIVYFVSKNFNNTLHWVAVKPDSSGQIVTYSVQYKSDTGKQLFHKKEGCQNISALSCDLTAETPSVPDVHYWAQVLVNGRVHGQTVTRFKPMAHTTLGPPILSTYIMVSNLHVKVTLPSGPDGRSIAAIINNVTLRDSEPQFLYSLTITKPKWVAQVDRTTTDHFIINLRNNQTEYCGYVVYRISAEPGRKESEKAFFCQTLPGDSLSLLPWILTAAGLLATIATVLAVWTCNYVKGGKGPGIPQKLVIPSGTLPRILKSLDKDLMISPLALDSDRDNIVYSTVQVKPHVFPVGVEGYFAQDIPCKARQDSNSGGSPVGTEGQSSTSGPEDKSAQSSSSYGAVVVHVPAEERDFQQVTFGVREPSSLQSLSSKESWEKAVMSVTSHRVPPLPLLDHHDSYQTRPLLLDAVRDNNGQLVLSSLAFQFQSEADDMQRKPLLSDLIESSTEGPALLSRQSSDVSKWSDSGCDDGALNTPVQSHNSHYSPSQPVLPDSQQGGQNPPGDISDTGYKENWIPAIIQGAACKNNGEYRGTNYSWAWAGLRREEESEEEEGSERGERSGDNLLGGWMLQLQE